jgi:hypothetical protein
MLASESKSDSVVEFHRRAAEARRMAETATDPIERADFLAIEQRWLTLAQSQSSPILSAVCYYTVRLSQL